MKEPSQIYVQLGYETSLNSKKNVLSSEISLLNLIKIIKRYNSLRLEELKIKSKINKSVKELEAKTKAVQLSFPFLKIPQVEINSSLRERKIKENFEENLESQLREIKEKLRIIEKA